MQHLQPDTLLQNGKYKIERVLGQGGFGITYLARNTVFDADVAIKEFFLKDENSRESGSTCVSLLNDTKQPLFDSQKNKFKKEARRLFRLSNAHVVHVIDLFEENGTAYYVMDYIEGESLSSFMKRESRCLSEEEVQQILTEILDALGYVHSNDMFHLDLKPANIMKCRDGSIRLIDFGASKQLGADSGVTTSTAFCYTPGYAPSEQISQNSAHIGAWTDIYSLGATLYNLLTGENPSHVDVENNDSFRFHSGISEGMQKLIVWMMSPMRRSRPQSVSEIQSCLEGDTQSQDSPQEPTVREETVIAGSSPHPSGEETVISDGASSITESANGLCVNIKGVLFNMIRVDGGTFVMGATSEQGSDAEDDEKPVHNVTLGNYFIGETQVTQELWQAVMGSNPSRFTGYLQRPVESVSWNDCQEFIKKLNQLTGKTFRLPTEAEWEYAARGGSKSQGYKYAGSNTIGDVAWYAINSSSTTHPVRQKQANELGLYDMSGNVWEWCQDWYGDYSSGSQTNPTGPSSGSYRVLRGGGWYNDAAYCRVSIRNYYSPESGGNDSGLRLSL